MKAAIGTAPRTVFSLAEQCGEETCVYCYGSSVRDSDLIPNFLLSFGIFNFVVKIFHQDKILYPFILCFTYIQENLVELNV